MTYSEQLAQRKQEAADEEAAFIAHFGPEANNCANWDSLWQRGWHEVLVNPAPTDTYQPKGLPPGGGGWVSKDGRKAGAYPPSLYSDKFLFYFARQLADNKAELVVRVTDYLLANADEMDCDLLTEVIDTITVYLHSPALHHVAGTGYALEVGGANTVHIEGFFRNWNSKKDASGLFITGLGIAIANKRVVPAEVAKGKLQAVRRQIEARQQQLQAGLFIRTPKEQEGKMSLPTLALVLIYEGKTLQRGEQAALLARNAGHTSGDSLYNEYCKYLAKDNRLGFSNDTARKGRNMINRIQAALPHLSETAKQQAENEINVIKARIS